MFICHSSGGSGGDSGVVEEVPAIGGCMEGVGSVVAMIELPHMTRECVEIVECPFRALLLPSIGSEVKSLEWVVHRHRQLLSPVTSPSKMLGNRETDRGVSIHTVPCVAESLQMKDQVARQSPDVDLFSRFLHGLALRTVPRIKLIECLLLQEEVKALTEFEVGFVVCTWRLQRFPTQPTAVVVIHL